MATVTTFLEPGTDATQDLSFFSSTSGTVASDNAQSHTGLRSLKCSTGAGAAAALANTAAGALTDTGSQVSTWVFFDTLPNALAQFLAAMTSGLLSVWRVQLNTDGTLRMATTGGGTAGVGTTVLSVNTWFHLSISYYMTSTSVYQIKLYLNGVLEATANSGTNLRVGSSVYQVGPVAAAGANRNFWFDDLYAATGGASSGAQPDPGDIRVTAKRPNANGTANGFTTQIGAGGSGYGTGHSPQVNEQPLSQTNGWSMIGAGSAVTEEYNVEGVATGDVNITGLALVDWSGWVFAKSLASETANIIVGGATSSISLTSTATMFTKAAASTTYPAGTGTDIGMVTDTSLTTVSLYECGVIVAYNPATDTQEWRGCYPPPRSVAEGNVSY